jgi:hypothetical protein
VPIASRDRTRVKNRLPALQVAPQIVQVAGMLGWPPPPGAEDDAVRMSNSPVDLREGNVYTVEGDVWRGKLEDNDCDLHVEMSAPGGSIDDDRVILEIPFAPEFATARQALIRALGCSPTGCSEGRAINLRAPVRMRMTGLSFWDGVHWSRKDPQRGHGHGTTKVGSLWELHPVWQAEVVGGRR